MPQECETLHRYSFFFSRSSGINDGDGAPRSPATPPYGASNAVLHVLEAVLRHHIIWHRERGSPGIREGRRFCSLDKAGTVALLNCHVKKGELADHQRRDQLNGRSRFQLTLPHPENRADPRIYRQAGTCPVCRCPRPGLGSGSRPNGAGFYFHYHAGGGYGLNDCSLSLTPCHLGVTALEGAPPTRLRVLLRYC